MTKPISSHTITIEMEVEIDVEYLYIEGRPATPPAYSHGGLPPDPPEVEISRIMIKQVKFEDLPELTREAIEDMIVEHEEAREPDYD